MQEVTQAAQRLRPIAASVYANEWDKHAAHWLSCLPLQFDQIDTRPIKEVKPDEVRSFRQCHFFAGIGGWPLALEIAGWPVDAPVWTGSCPCQPFSQAGKRKGTADERHLWPEFRRLIDECRPTTIFGEQVASKAGRDWLATVRTDLEALGYAVGAADLCAASVGAPHIRQRLFWVAHCNSGRLKEHLQRNGDSSECGQQAPCGSDAGGCCEDGRGEQKHLHPATRPSHWDDIEFIECRDGKARPVKPGIRLLAHGIPGRVAQLRGLGNAIVPQVAAEFIASFMETQHALP